MEIISFDVSEFCPVALAAVFMRPKTRQPHSTDSTVGGVLGTVRHCGAVQSSEQIIYILVHLVALSLRLGVHGETLVFHLPPYGHLLVTAAGAVSRFRRCAAAAPLQAER